MIGKSSCRDRSTGGSSKRMLADGSWLHLHTIGKLRRPRLPLPPGFTKLEWSA